MRDKVFPIITETVSGMNEKTNMAVIFSWFGTVASYVSVGTLQYILTVLTIALTVWQLAEKGNRYRKRRAIARKKQKEAA